MTRRGALLALPVVLALTFLPSRALPRSVTSSALDARITNDVAAGSYRRSDGGIDAVTTACSSGRRQQVEPTVAVDPRNPAVVVAGSKDRCKAAGPSGASDWVGYYRSIDGGKHWLDSLVPGYPGDTSAAGLASPAHGCINATDPTQAFDLEGQLFYGFICVRTSTYTLYVATYGSDGSRYERTVEVSTRILPDVPPVSGPHGRLTALLNPDKPNLVVDKSDRPSRGNVYIGWVSVVAPDVTINGALGDLSAPTGLTVMMVARSGDHGKSFSFPAVVVPPADVGQPDLADLAVGPDGTVYLAYRTLPRGCGEELLSLPQVCGKIVPIPRARSIGITRSVDEGRTFGLPKEIARIDPFDSAVFGGSGNAEGGCGDGPFACPKTLTFPGFFSQSAVAADAEGVHVLWNSRLPSGQSKVFVRNSPDGVVWPASASILDRVAAGHQFWPDVASAGGVITAVFYDSRADPSYAPNRPPGVRADGSNPGGAIDAFAARSYDGGRTWIETKLSSVASNPNFETFSDSRTPFFGDYIYISAVPGYAYAAWTDSRDLISGADPREPGVTDGFDGASSCVYRPNNVAASAYTSPLGSDPCLSHGGLDLNIYGAGL